MQEYEYVTEFATDAAFYAEAERRLTAKPQTEQTVSGHWREKYEKEHVRNWDRFYKHNQTNFFKDRHYLVREFGLKEMGSGLFVELGCGVGNALVPLVVQHENIVGVGLDCSQVAIDLLNGRDKPNARCRGLVMDMTKEEWPQEVADLCEGKADYVSLIFSLSACHPETHRTVVKNVKRLLKPGGFVLFRDYAKFDLAQLRFADKQALLADNFYVRGDGTKAKFFAEEEVAQLFGEEDWHNEHLKVHAKKFVNRKDNVHMHRLWIQGSWRLRVRSMTSDSVVPLEAASE